jgi:hypothetical protein
MVAGTPVDPGDGEPHDRRLQGRCRDRGGSGRIGGGRWSRLWGRGGIRRRSGRHGGSWGWRSLVGIIVLRRRRLHVDWGRWGIDRVGVDRRRRRHVDRGRGDVKAKRRSMVMMVRTVGRHSQPDSDIHSACLRCRHRKTNHGQGHEDEQDEFGSHEEILGCCRRATCEQTCLLVRPETILPAWPGLGNNQRSTRPVVDPEIRAAGVTSEITLSHAWRIREPVIMPGAALEVNAIANAWVATRGWSGVGSWQGSPGGGVGRWWDESRGRDAAGARKAKGAMDRACGASYKRVWGEAGRPWEAFVASRTCIVTPATATREVS